jgi:hypothetical protein
MLPLAVLSFMTGIALGMRYTVFVLLPASFCLLPIALLVGLYGYSTAGLVILTGAATLASLQIGYLAGIVLHYLLAESRVGALPRASRSPPPPDPGLAH